MKALFLYLSHTYLNIFLSHPEIETTNNIAIFVCNMEMIIENSGMLENRNSPCTHKITKVSRYNSVSVLHWWSIIGGWGLSQMTNGMKSRNDTLSYISHWVVFTSVTSSYLDLQTINRRCFHNHGEGPYTRVISWLKTHTAFHSVLNVKALEVLSTRRRP